MPEEVFTLFPVLVEQYFEFAWELADDVVVLDCGAVVMEWPRADLSAERASALVSF
ncbi:MAG: hypothetical protein AAF415_11100 [Pseudomonadota bacterium]